MTAAPVTKKIIFVCYGGGHVNMVIPLLQALRQRPKYQLEFEVLGLTTAGAALARANLPFIGFRDLLRPNDTAALDAGRRLAQTLDSQAVPRAETIAYLGLSYRDLEQRLGAAAAAKIYAAKGRQAFLPVTVMKRFLAERKPALVVTTNSPRAERAAIIAAGQLGIKSVCLVDLFATWASEWIGRPGYADRVCVFADYVKALLLAKGRRADEVRVTGNPAFDALARPGLATAAARLRQTRGWGDARVILWASQPETAAHVFSGKIADPSLPRRVDRELFAVLQRHPGWRLVIRPHPSERIGYAGLPANVELSGQEDDLPTLLAAVDLVLVMSSTVGLQAALLQRPVVALQESVYAADVPYPALGVAYGVATVAELETGLAAVLAGRWRPHGILPPPGRATDGVLSVIDELLEQL